LPSLLTAVAAQVSVRHFFIKLFFAAPANVLPSLPIALLSQVAREGVGAVFCSAAYDREPIAKQEISIAARIAFIEETPSD